MIPCRPKRQEPPLPSWLKWNKSNQQPWFGRLWIRIPEGIVFAVKSEAIRPLLSASGNTDALKSAKEVEKDYSAEDVARGVERAVVRVEDWSAVSATSSELLG